MVKRYGFGEEGGGYENVFEERKDGCWVSFEYCEQLEKALALNANLVKDYGAQLQNESAELDEANKRLNLEYLAEHYTETVKALKKERDSLRIDLASADESGKISAKQVGEMFEINDALETELTNKSDYITELRKEIAELKARVAELEKGIMESHGTLMVSHGAWNGLSDEISRLTQSNEAMRNALIKIKCGFDPIPCAEAAIQKEEK